MKYYKDRVLHGVDLSFAIVTGLVIIGFIFLYLSKRKDTIIKFNKYTGYVNLILIEVSQQIVS